MNTISVMDTVNKFNNEINEYDSAGATIPHASVRVRSHIRCAGLCSAALCDN